MTWANVLDRGFLLLLPRGRNAFIELHELLFQHSDLVVHALFPYCMAWLVQRTSSFIAIARALPLQARSLGEMHGYHHYDHISVDMRM
jgi:hypothetical protein